MKKLVPFILFMCCTIFIQAQSSEIRKLYRKAHRSEQTTKVNLPGILIDLGALIAKKSLIEETGDKQLYRSIKKINALRVVSTADKKFIESERTARLFKRVNNKMEPLIKVNTENEKISILIKEKRNKIKKVVLIGHMEDEFVLLSANSNLKLDQLKQLLAEKGDDLIGKDILP